MTGLNGSPVNTRSPVTKGKIIACLLLSFSLVNLAPLVVGGPGDETVSAADELYVAGWTFPWDEPTIESIRDHSDVLDEVSPYWYWVMPNGTIQPTHNETEDPGVIRFCMDHGIGIVPMISNNHNPQTVINLIHNSTMQQQHIQSLIITVRRLFYAGIDINYEEIPSAEKNGFTSFINNLTQVFHQYGKKVHVSVFPKVSSDENREGPGAYDYEALGAIVDKVRVMAYNLHWSSVDYAGPVTARDWLEVVLGYASTAIPKEKVVLGVAQYGYDWVVGKNHKTLSIADNVSYPDVISLIKEYNVERKWNATSRTPYIEYKDRKGANHEVHYCDAESLMHQLRLLGDLSLNGISIWKIGGEDPDIWQFLKFVQNNGLDDLPPYLGMGGNIKGMRGAGIDFGPVRAYDIEGTLRTIHWDFGDGVTSDLLEPVHQYNRGGYYQAVLTLGDDSGNIMQFPREVQIGPYSMFKTEGELQVGSLIHFNGSYSWDLEGIISYSWDFGDGMYLFHSTPEADHQFSRPGVYNTSLTIINTRGYTDTSVEQLVIPDLEPPKAVDLDDVIEAWEGTEIILDGWGSTDNSGFVNFTWDIQDCGTFYGQIIRFSMDDPGIYNCSLTVTDPAGLMDVEKFLLKVRDRTPPQISIGYPREIDLGETVEVTILGSRDNVGIANITWDLGQGRIIYGTDTISFTPPVAKRYYITVDVIDGEGNWNSSTIYIDVKDVKPPSGEFHIDPTPLGLNDTYLPSIMNDVQVLLPELYGVILYNNTYIFSVSNVSDDSGVSNITWWFGDGERAGGPIVYHEYEKPGVYKTELVIDDVWGNELNIGVMLLAIVSWNQSVNEIWSYVDVFINNTVYVEPTINEDDAPVIDLMPFFLSLMIAVTVLITLGTIYRIGREQFAATRKKNIGGKGDEEK